MVAIEEIEQKLLALPLKHRVFLAESLLASVPFPRKYLRLNYLTCFWFSC